MATTTNFGWETPDDTDLVKDGAAAMRTLGNSIDTSFVDLKGGTTGQILSKASNTDLDYTWIANDVGDITAVTAGTGISGGGTSGAVTITNSMATTIDAKGDLIGGTGSDTFARLAVGANGTVLTADSAETTGLKWAVAASVGTYVSFTPTVKQGTTTMTLYTAGADGQNYYTQSGKFVHCMGELYMSSTGTGSQAIEMSLPVNIDTSIQSTIFTGSGYLRDSSAATNYAFIIGNNGNNNKVFFYSTASSGGSTLGNSTFTSALDTADTIRYSFVYRSV